MAIWPFSFKMSRVYKYTNNAILLILCLCEMAGLDFYIYLRTNVQSTDIDVV